MVWIIHKRWVQLITMAAILQININNQILKKGSWYIDHQPIERTGGLYTAAISLRKPNRSKAPNWLNPWRQSGMVTWPGQLTLDGRSWIHVACQNGWVSSWAAVAVAAACRDLAHLSALRQSCVGCVQVLCNAGLFFFPCEESTNLSIAPRELVDTRAAHFLSKKVEHKSVFLQWNEGINHGVVVWGQSHVYSAFYLSAVNPFFFSFFLSWTEFTRS